MGPLWGGWEVRIAHAIFYVCVRTNKNAYQCGVVGVAGRRVDEASVDGRCGRSVAPGGRGRGVGRQVLFAGMSVR
jgi:hypothetical protein